MAASSLFNNLDGIQQTSSILAEAGGLEIKTNTFFDESGSSITTDNSYVLLQGKSKELFQFQNGNVVLKAPSDGYIGVGQNLFTSIYGDSQHVQGGDNHQYIQGDHTKQVGQATSKQVDAAKNLQKATSKIDQKKCDVIKNTQGTQVPCPNCSTEVLVENNGNCLVDLAFKILRLAIPNLPYPLEIIQKFLNFLGLDFLLPQPVKQLNGGTGCGSPGCQNGMVRSPQNAIQEGNKQAADELKAQQKQIGKHQTDLGSGGSHLMGPFMGDVAIHVGHPEAINTSPTVVLKDNHTVPFGFTNQTTPAGAGFIPHTKGNTKRAIHTDPLINPGSLTLQIGQKFTLITGSPGIDIHTTGKTQLNAAVTTINATQGELTLASNNVTMLKGKNIIIDANDKSGDSGIRLDAKNIMVAGALHIQGDHSVKGALMTDGGVYCTHITCPGERVSSGPTGDAHQVHSGATWNNPVMGLQATLYDTYDKIYKTASRDLFNVLSLNIANGMAEIKTLIEEQYHSALLKIPVDNAFMPTGYATTYFAPPGVPAGGPLLVFGVAYTAWGPAPVVAYVVQGQTLPIFNFSHNHNSPGNNHSHDYTALQSHPVGTNTAARAARPEPSHIPSPAKARGHGSRPGHKNMGDLCIPCLNFGNNNNFMAKYGVNPYGGNPFNGSNYVQSDGNIDENGNLTPPPKIDINCVN